ncbi:hypothetical protein OG607_28755 [Streptomyces sp. NBC_01537]|uniref:hypothetical protein n=1 Tax=Streptomyces sp. NBC_01537 TaxID=2903896 RepID=UPI00386E8287
MNAEAHGRSTTQQAGHDQHITTNNYYGPPPSTPPTVGDGGGWFSAHRGAWIASGASVLVALIGVLGSQLAGGGSNGTADDAASPTPTVSVSPQPSPSVSATTGSPTAQPSGGAVQWQGKLVLTEIDSSGDKDLDAPQPVDAGNRDDNDFYASNDTIRAHDHALVSVWDDSTRLPEFADCSSTVTAAGAGEQAVKEGMVLCVKTSEGRIGRLKVTEADNGFYSTLRFDGVVWPLAE